MDAIGLLAGSFFKLADELFDTQNKYLVEYSEYIKTGCIVFMTLFFILNVEQSLLFIISFIPVCYSLNQIDNDFWKSMIPIPFLTLALTVQNLKYLGFTDLLEKFSVIVLFGIICILEDKLFPEETSQEKTMFRSTMVFLGTTMLYMTAYFKSPEFHRAIIYTYPIAYCGTSVLVKMFLTEDVLPAPSSHGGEIHRGAYSPA